ncbi:MAG: VOC family protein [Bauldia sp.]
MIIHRGRLLDHLHLSVADLNASQRFYKAVIAALGKSITVVEGPHFFFADELWVETASGQPTHVHFAFQADNEEIVRRFHAAGIAAGGHDNGPPGPRNYHPGYFAAYLLDPDGNNVEAVFHGPARRSADSITFEPETPAQD